MNGGAVDAQRIRTGGARTLVRACARARRAAPCRAAPCVCVPSMCNIDAGRDMRMALCMDTGTGICADIWMNMFMDTAMDIAMDIAMDMCSWTCV